MRKIILVALILSVSFSVLPMPAQADHGFSLVPCGRSDQIAAGDVHAQCDLNDLLILIVRLINYLISVAAIVAMYHVLLSGWNLITAMGNEENIKAGKAGISNAVVGFAMVILAFVFVNLLVNGIFGRPDTQRKWWDITCIYNINDTSGACPINGTPSPNP